MRQVLSDVRRYVSTLNTHYVSESLNRDARLRRDAKSDALKVAHFREPMQIDRGGGGAKKKKKKK